MNGSTNYNDPAAELLAAVVHKAGGEMRLYPQDIQLGKANPLVRWDTADPPCITPHKRAATTVARHPHDR